MEEKKFHMEGYRYLPVSLFWYRYSFNVVFFKTVIQYTGHTIRGGRGSRAGIVPQQWAPQRGKKLFSKYNGTVQENLIPEQKNYLKPLLRSRAFYVCRRSRTFPNFALFQATAALQTVKTYRY